MMSSNGAYSHRTHQPGIRPAVQSSTRVADALDSIKQEFEVLQADRDALRVQRDEFEAQVNAQTNEVNGIRRSLYDLEIQQGKVRQHYEEELRRLRAEVATLRQGNGPPVVPPGIPGFQPLTLTLSGPPRPGPAPSSLSDSYTRDRDHDRTKEKPRVPTSPTTEDDWELRPKSRDIRENDRMRDIREPKRFKPEPVPSAETASARDPDVPGNLPPPHTLYSVAGSTSSLRTKGRDPAEYQVTLPPINTSQQPLTEELSLSTVPPECRKEGTDWFAVFNPRVKRSLDISLVHNFTHER